MAEQVFSESDSGSRVSARSGDIITIQLAENASTGFQWAVEHVDEPVVTLQDSRYDLPPSPRVGQGGTRRMIFKAEQAGTASIQLKYWRSWEGDRSVRQRFEIEVVVAS